MQAAPARTSILRRRFLALGAGAATAFAKQAWAAGDASRYARFDGLRVHYESYGAGSEALVFIHGWACDLTFWRGQDPLYNRPDRRALLIDLLRRFERRSVRAMTVNTQSSNLRSQRLYTGFGFERTGYDLPVWTVEI